MPSFTLDSSSVIAPIHYLATCDAPAVLAVITDIEGPSYRPLGATMALGPEGLRVGSLSSGCVESDISLHAQEVASQGQMRVLRYGRGSPFVDIQLPCGGGLEITLVPHPDRAVLDQILQAHVARRPVTLGLNLETGSLSVAAQHKTGRVEGDFFLYIEPETNFYVFGKGPEAATFVSLAHSAGFDALLMSPDQETLDIAINAGIRTRHLTSAHFPSDLALDAYSAVVLFFHDHDWEPPILARAVQSPAFYIGAQGSKRAADQRLMQLEALGHDPADLARIRGPIGLIPSVRDARKLAVSVLADVLNSR